MPQPRSRHRVPHRSRDEHQMEFSRIVAFSDGVFAIAITLLVLQINVPSGVESSASGDLADALLDQDGDLLAYGISFAVIGRFWIVHHHLFGDIIRFDATLMALNLLYLAWMVLIPFSSEVLGDYGGHGAAIVLYALNLVLVTSTGGLMATYAVRAGLTVPERAEGIRSDRNGGLFAGAVFLVSIPVALVAPGVAPFVWLGVLFDPTPRMAAWHRRRRGAT